MSVAHLATSENKDDGHSTGLRLQTRFERPLVEWAKIKANVRALLRAGRTQKSFGESSSGSGVSVREAALEANPFSFLRLQAGANNQEFLNAPLLVEDLPFPGVIEEATLLNSNGHKLKFTAQQSLPTSQSLNTERVDKEPLPTFMTETLSYEMKSSDPVQAQISLTHFRFSELPSVVAFNSQPYGNSVDGQGKSTSRFQYGFGGLMAGSEFCYCTNPYNVRVGGMMLQNSEAPESVNRAQLAYVGLDWRMKNVVISPRYERFFSEKDATPAYYSEELYGHSNRVGQAAKLNLTFEDLGFKVVTRYFNSNPIQANLSQFPSNTWEIKVETLYVQF